jgi:hypothetical protein
LGHDCEAAFHRNRCRHQHLDWIGRGGPDLRTFAAAPTSVTLSSVTKIDFDRVFADVMPQGVGYVERARKGDRLSRVKPASPEPALPYCEPVASPYSDPILGRIIGRCAA